MQPHLVARASGQAAKGMFYVAIAFVLIHGLGRGAGHVTGVIVADDGEAIVPPTKFVSATNAPVGERRFGSE
jgi:hypothetical protein